MESNKKEELLSPLIDSLEVSIKGLMILSDKEADISRADVIRKLENSNEEEVREFLNLIKEERKGSDINILFATLGEFLLSSFLFVMGILFVIPTFFGGNASGYLLNYYGNALHSISETTGLTSLTIVINFLVAVVLLLASFSTLKTARMNIRFLFR
ncbi:MAG: hypothetical protein M1323_03615 [Candidatus Thermoplasmatota archaeon]|nr:hypothetical protein [Candidatus Thermoplasmatota archaeon]OWP54199.1 MAG: hypothetical protein B2I18_02600 [Cuniculiplasma sp. C_DKE]